MLDDAAKGLEPLTRYLFEVCRAHTEFLPAVSVHPGRPDALAEFMLGVDFQSGRSCEDGVEVYFLITIY
jgi:hypothetical protein